ncbi:carbohydrate ABC transporter permease [Iamia sp. SCSIO 61187]|uniref:carbohydrate ABC transporter permease n=1 Tax=Iamia sp. SCSIO 61187 TaxID=2722752 RepID=UPI001C62FA23|nr:sugar ABC transporter permease [Iamia sp. SCSIO 61187]
MAQLLTTILQVLAIVGVTLGLFLAANAAVDLARTRFTLYSILIGAAVGVPAGALANSGGWFKGGGLWPLGGAVVGALVGALRARVRPPSAERARRIPDRWRPVIFLAPALSFLFIGLVVPAVRTIYLSFRSRRGDEAVGLENYRSVLGNSDVFSFNGIGDVLSSRLAQIALVLVVIAVVTVVLRGPARGRGADLGGPVPVVSLSTAAALVVLAMMGALRGVIWNNLFWVVFVTGFATVLGLAIAALADRAAGESVAKSLIFLPMAISFVGASVIWRFVYAFVPARNDQIGLLNGVWVGLGGEPQAWIQDRPWNSLFLIFILIWIQTGFAMVLLSAAIKGVPHELIEAAEVDGATTGQIFWRVTLPSIRPTVIVVVTTLIVTVLKVYDIVKVMTNGEFGTSVIANEMFQEAFIARDLGVGSTLAVLLFMAVLPLMAANMWRVRREATS